MRLWHHPMTQASPRAVSAAAMALVGLLPVLCHGQTPKGGAATAGQLNLIDPVISQFEDGPPVGNQRVVPGESVFFRFGAAGYKTSDSGRVQLTGHLQVFDSRNVAIMSVDEVAVATTLRDEDKNWKPKLHFQFQIPPIAPPGTYRIHFEATDDQTKQKGTSEATFQVEGRNVPPSDSIVVRNLNFYRNPDEEIPLRVAAYRPGDAVWVKFDVTGYKRGEQNSIDVTYDVAVTDSQGKQVFSQPDAASEKSQAYYAQPWVPGVFSLTLQGNTRPGEYHVSITARDGIGDKSVTATTAFQVGN